MSDRQTAIGKYQIIREIARSNDIVYEAYDPVMNRRVALKELAMPSGMNDTQREDRVKRFIREAKAAGSLNHPNIVTIYECGEEAGKYFIAMEYLDGHTLRNDLDTSGFIPIERAFAITLDVLSALEYAHANGVIHRDIKPENIQLLPDGRVKLTDFGIARLTFEPNITMDGQVFGTPSYMSPEQVVGKEIDVRSDLFGVGVVLYEMIAGEKPFKGDSVVSITYSIMNTQPVQPSQANHTVWQFLSRALEKSPQLRFANTADMISAAEAAANSLHSVVLDPGPTLGAMPAYGAAPPMNNPYMGGAYGTTQFAPPPQPAVYPYDPYQQAQAQTGMPQPVTTPYGQPQVYGPPPQPLTQVPLYYPAPRKPMMTPETKDFLGKLFLTVVVLGSVLGLVMVGVWALGVAIQRSQDQDKDATLRRDLGHLSSMPVDERIKEREIALPKLRDTVSREEEERQLALDYAQKGAQLAQSGDLVAASAAYQRGLEYDKTNSAISYALGDIYLKQASIERDSALQFQLKDVAAGYLSDAAANEQDPNRHGEYGNSAASIDLELARAEYRSGNKRGARNRLFRARRFARPGSQLAVNVQQLLAEITR